MRQLILIAPISLDGFVDGQNGELDDFDIDEENLEFIDGLTLDADADLLGRILEVLLQSYWPTTADRLSASKGEIQYSS